MQSSEERRGLWGALGISFALHAAALSALVLAVQAYPDGSRAGGSGAGGTGVVFVELLRGDGTGAPAPTVSTPPAARVPRPRVAQHPVPRRPVPAVPVATREASPVVARVPVPSRTTPPEARPEPRVEPVAGSRGAPRQVALAASTAPQQAAAAAERASAATGSSGGVGRSPATGSGRATGAAGDGPLSRVARPLSEIRPVYPPAARERGDEASVVVEAWVGASGRVERARVQHGAGREFDTAALDAVREARFLPAWRDGTPVASVVAMRVHFALER